MSKIIIFFIRAYQKLISPLFPQKCRFYPTCSEYMAESIKKNGLLKGSFYSIYRIIRCNPFNQGGYDPVR